MPVGAFVLLAACSSIVGVEDVTLRDVLRRDAGGGSSGEDPGGVPPTVPGVPGVPPTPPGTGKHTPCEGDPDCVRLVFVTSAVFSGNLGGISGANQKCTTAGQKIQDFEETNFRAFLSDSTHDAKESLPKGTKGYRRSDGNSVANNWTDMLDGSLSVPIVFNEDGTQVDAEAEVWTGTDRFGVASADNCGNWLSSLSTSNGLTGRSFETNSFWTEFVHDECDKQKHLVCVEF